jgi:hypothetical protein
MTLTDAFKLTFNEQAFVIPYLYARLFLRDVCPSRRPALVGAYTALIGAR